MPFAAGYPYLNQIFGDAAYEIKARLAERGPADRRQRRVLRDRHRGRQARGIVRELPPAEPRCRTRIRTRTKCTYFRPYGFNPREETEETDQSGTVGFKGEVGTWNWDISSTYGKDEIDMFTRDSANASLYAATGETPVELL